MTTLAEPTTVSTRTPMSDKEAKAAAQAEALNHRREVAAGAVRALPQHVKSGLDGVSPEIGTLIADGSWTSAATAIDASGNTSLASWLRLETPYALDC